MLLKSFSFLSLILSAAIFGFFFAWVCSTMWGLDAIDPRVSIAAMQGMNASVRNAVFAPAFFGTPLVLAITTVIAFMQAQRPVGLIFAAATAISFLGGVLLTAAMNIPMNEALAIIDVPDDLEAARTIWEDYSGEWQFWNQTRTVFTGIVVILVGFGLGRVFQSEKG